MGRRYRCKSDLPIKEFDRDCRKAGDFVWGAFMTVVALGVYAYKSCRVSDNSITGTYYNDRPSRYRDIIPQKPDPKEYSEDIQRLESLVKNKSITLKQCEHLAGVYNALQDFQNEKRMRILALEIFMKDCGEESRFLEIITAFNDPCKKPPETICDNELINEDYRLLLRKAETAKKKSYKFKKLHRL